MIQEVISRMANNSFALKGWTVTLAAGIFTLSGNAIRTNFWFLFLPIIIFRGLDAFYLSKERSSRALYKHMTGLSPVRLVSRPAHNKKIASTIFQLPMQHYTHLKFPFYMNMFFKNSFTITQIFPFVNTISN